MTNTPVSWKPAFLWGQVYKGVEIGRIWLGWTSREWKKRGW